jgi:mRNA-degrading endonuclease toxin of MazEF toxin-antitoxin module
MDRSVISFGQVFDLELPPQPLNAHLAGSEIHSHKSDSNSNMRPCLVVSTPFEKSKMAEKTVIVVPITSSPRHKENYWAVLIPKVQLGLLKDSYALIDQVRAVDVRRFKGSMRGKIGSGFDLLCIADIKEKLNELLQ